MSRFAAVGLITRMLAGVVGAKGHPAKGEQCAAAKLKAATKRTASGLSGAPRRMGKAV
jgi:hypothetical protein